MGRARKLLKGMVGLEGIEPPTNGLGNRCSILLSYRPTMICGKCSLAGAVFPTRNQGLGGFLGVVWTTVRITYRRLRGLVSHKLADGIAVNPAHH